MNSLQRIKIPLLGKSAQSFDPMAYARMKVDSLNARPGNLEGSDCQECKNKGYIMDVWEDGTIYSRDCRCMAMRRCVRRMEESGLKGTLDRLTFDRFQVKEAWQRAIFEAAQSYAVNPNGWFVICGQSGGGKTHLCTAICRELLLRGREVLYTPWRDEISRLKAMSLDADRREREVKRLESADVLYIDDFLKCGAGPDGTARPTAADISVAMEVLNSRYSSLRTTILSSELFPAEIVQLDEALGGRIVEMAGGNPLVIGRAQGRNHRLQAATMV